MALGSIKISQDLMDKGTPDFHAALQSFLDRGTVKSKVWSKPGIYTITIDHPDFLKGAGDTKYDLIITRKRDGWGNSMYAVSCLKRLSADGRWHVVKDYLRKTDVHLEGGL